MNYLKSLYESSPSVSIKLEPNNCKCFKYISKDNKIISYPTYYDNDKISGLIELKLNSNKSTIIDSIKILLIGIIQNKNISEKIYEEILPILEANSPLTLINEITNFNFCFKQSFKPYESYFGECIQIKYYLKVIVNTKKEDFSTETIENHLEICCLKPISKNICEDYFLNKNNNKEININIGIENVIHVKINLLKSKYCLDDEIIGKITIVKSETTLNNIFLEIKREEKININNLNLAYCQDLAKFELMEGIPEEGDEMFFRFYLNGVKNLSPSYYNTDEKEKKYEVRYFLTFEFNDDKGYQFFKNVEIEIYRMNLNNLILDNNNKENNKKTFISIKNKLNDK